MDRRFIKTYERKAQKTEKNSLKTKITTPKIVVKKRQPLSTKEAVEFLLQGSLKKKVCRFCLNLSSHLSELDQIMQISGTSALYKVTIKDMLATIHPFKLANDPNLPNKICNKCIDRTLSSYLFSQQCERAERAMRNCFDDLYEKFDKLDTLDFAKRRGRKKLHPNHDKLYPEHEKVIDYAEPIINMVNRGSFNSVNNKLSEINKLECLKCCEILPSIESLVNHEKIHPSTMWFNCRYCGRSFPKRHLIKKHIKTEHIMHNELSLPCNENDSFTCKDCGNESDTYSRHLEHIEKHKFKMALEHLVERKTDRLCAVCLQKGSRMTNLDKMVCLHGGYPEISGDKTLYNILASTLPDMNFLHNYTGTKICDNCLNLSITSYTFLNRTRYVRFRLTKCINLMLDSLSAVSEPSSNLMVEISQNAILDTKDTYDVDELLLSHESDVEETKLQVDVLEDEFRVDSEESDYEDSDMTPNTNSNKRKQENIEPDFNNSPGIEDDFMDILENPARNSIRTYTKAKLVNGYQEHDIISNNDCKIDDVCSEFLTFKDKKPAVKKVVKRFTCPFCCKHFISDYWLRRHLVKHYTNRSKCCECDKVFPSKFLLYEHNKMVHILKQTNYNVCKTCGRGFVDDNKMKLHLRSHITKRCQLCDKLFVTQLQYDKHIYRHMLNVKVNQEIRKKTCSFCESAFSSDNKLSLHVNKVHLQIKQYACDMCEKSFYVEGNLKNHRRVHSAFNKEVCQLCDRTLKCRRDLVIHIRKHVGDKPFECPLCDQRFYSENKLRLHQKTLHKETLPKSLYTSKCELKQHVVMNHSAL